MEETMLGGLAEISQQISREELNNPFKGKYSEILPLSKLELLKMMVKSKK
jgi:hypothetical protein